MARVTVGAQSGLGKGMPSVIPGAWRPGSLLGNSPEAVLWADLHVTRASVSVVNGTAKQRGRCSDIGLAAVCEAIATVGN